jgi:hypothetical protein
VGCFCGFFGAVSAVVDSGEVLEVCLGEDSAKCVKEELVKDAVADAREDLVTIAREALGTMEEGEVKIKKCKGASWFNDGLCHCHRF